MQLPDGKTELPVSDRPHVPEDYLAPEGEGRLLPWEHVSERLAAALNYWIATVDPQGRPHATPVWGIWLDGTLYFDGSPQTRRARNIAANPAVAVHLESGDDVVIVHGDAYELKAPPRELTVRLAEAYAAKYVAKEYEPEPTTWDQGGLYALTVRRAFAWTSFPHDMTRWRF